jgi:hypothetical protein
LFTKVTVSVVVLPILIGEAAKLIDVIAGSASFCATDLKVNKLKQ